MAEEQIDVIYNELMREIFALVKNAVTNDPLQITNIQSKQITKLSTNLVRYKSAYQNQLSTLSQLVSPEGIGLQMGFVSGSVTGMVGGVIGGAATASRVAIR